jgi:hypothetical protein
MPASRQVALALLGLLLVAVPLYAPPLDLTGQDYEYRAAQIRVDDDRLVLTRTPTRLRGVEGIDCFHEMPVSRRCALEASLLDGSSRAIHPNVRRLSGDPTLDAPDRYVAFAGDGRVFERTADWRDGSYVVGLERVAAARALDAVSRPAEAAPRAVRRTVETGSAVTAHRLDPRSRIVESSGRYYVVYEAGQRSDLVEKPFTERLFEAVAVVGGVLVLRRAWR